MNENVWRSRLSRRRLLQGAAAASGAGLGALALAGCGGRSGGSAAGTKSSGAQPAGQPRRGGKIATYSGYDVITGFEPHAASSFAVDDQAQLSMVYNTLVSVGVGGQYKFDDRQVRPSLAATWEQPDDQTYVFHLRPDVKFQDKPPVNGRALVADDVAFSFQRLLQSPFGYKNWYETIQSTTATDPQTVTIKTSSPDAPLLLRIALGYTWVIAREAGKADPKGAAMGLNFTDPTTAIGTGPFLLDQWEPGQRITYKRNPNYFESGLPYLDQVEYRTVPDYSTQLSLLQTGQVDFGLIPVGSQGQVKATAPKVNILEPYNPMCYARGWRNDQQPFNDIRVRRAIAMAHDEKELAASWGTPESPLAFGAAWPVAGDGYLPLNQLGDAAKWWQPNVAEAKQLMAAAGYADGFDTVYHGSAVSRDKDQTELFASQMAKIGIRVKLDIQEHAQQLATTAIGKYDGMGFWGIQEPQADDFFSALVPGQTKNVGHVDDPKLTDMVKKQRTIMDAKQRQAALQEIARYLADQVYLASFPQLLVPTGVYSYVKNYQPRPGFQNLLTVTWLDK